MTLFRFHEELDAVELRESAAMVSEADQAGCLEVAIEAIHAGITRNYTRYSAKELNDATVSWFVPYQRPVLLHHNRRGGEPIGRVMSASFGPSVHPGVSECITLEASIVDPDAMRRVKDSRYMTVSVGGTAEQVICSICNVDRAKAWCDHRPGIEYDGKLCVYDMKNIMFDEISFVNVPADQYAGVVGISTDEVIETEQSKESDDDQVKQENLAPEPDRDVIGVQEAASVVGEAKAGGDPTRPKGKDGKPIGKMKTGTRKQAYYGHNLLHGYWRKGNTNWTKAQIIAEHKRVVKIMLGKGWQHTMLDSLDETLPAPMKKKSRKKSK